RALGFVRRAAPLDFEVTVSVSRMLDEALGTAEPDVAVDAAQWGPLIPHPDSTTGPATCEVGRRRRRSAMRWGELRPLDEPPRPYLVRGYTARRRRSAERGGVVGFPHRLLIDQR